MAVPDIFHLEPHGADTFVGTGPRYPWGGLFGGQIVAQALQAAAHTVEPGLRPHSLRAYFIRAGDHDEPVRYEVDRLRNGRSFTTRRVVARQSVGAILNLETSFTAGDDSPGKQATARPEAPSPATLPDDSWCDLFERRAEPYVLGSGRADLWLRWSGPLDGSGATDEAALAFMSDDVPTDALRALILEPGEDPAAFDEQWFIVSLDHTVWFHERPPADEWQLHSSRCDRYVAGRGLAVGEVFTESGVHVATVAQEMLLRRRRT